MEENVISGGFGEHVTEFYNNEKCKDIRIVNIAIPDEYVEHGNVELCEKKSVWMAGYDHSSAR